MNKKLTCMMAVLMALFSLNAHAYDAYIDGIYYNLNTSAKTATVTYQSTNYKSYSSAVNIPESFERNGVTYSVTAIGYNAFKDCTSIYFSVTIPETVTSIGDNAFKGCTSLASLTIPESVTSIGSSAFYGCSALTSINIPKGVTSLNSFLGSAFEGCNNLTHVEINSNSIVSTDRSYKSDGTSSLAYIFGMQVTEYVLGNDVKRIGNNAFMGNTNMESIILGNGLTEIGSFAFYNCSGLKSVTIPNSVTTIGRHAFELCTGLASVTIPNSVTSLDDGAFASCSSLTSVTIPSSITSIKDFAFCYCTSLTSFTIPSGVISIGQNAFEDCSGLLSVTIPNSVTSIGQSAFRDCRGLTSLIIPEGVTSIGSYAFDGCSGLTSVVIPSNVTSIGSSAFGSRGLTSITIPGTFKLSDLIGYYKPASLSLTVTGSSIVKEAYKDCAYVTSVTIPKTVYSIGANAFDGCKIKNAVIPSDKKVQSLFPTNYQDITSITFTDNYATMPDEVCAGCTSLTSVSIPSSVTTLGTSSFKDCSSLTSISIPSTVTKVGGDSFEGCTSLSKVHASDLTAWLNISFDSEDANPLFVAHHLYMNGSELQNLAIPEGVKEIKSYAFYGCEGLTSVEVPNTVKSIGYVSFYGCSNLATLKFSNAPITFGSSAFGNCSGLNKVNITDLSAWCNSTFSETSSNPLRYAHHLFLNDEEIRHLTIPEGVESVPQNAFYQCTGLKSLVIPEGCKTIGSNAFAGCSELLELYFPDGCLALYEKSFSDCMAIQTINSQSNTPPAIYITTFPSEIYETAVVYVSSTEVADAYSSAPRWENFANIVARDTEVITTIDISEDVELYNNSIEKEYEVLTYTRMFNNTNWQALYVPFSISYDDWKDDFEVAKINGFYEYDTDNDGAIDKQVLEILPVVEGQGDLRPNYPYLIKAKVACEKTLMLTDATLYRTEENSIDCATVETKYTFTGSYEKKTGLMSEGCYVIRDDSLKIAADDEVLGAFRWYMTMEDRGTSLMERPAAIKIRVVGEPDEDDATDIAELETGTPREKKSEVWYTLDGRRLSYRPTTKGIYLVNGKKVYVK